MIANEHRLDRLVSELRAGRIGRRDFMRGAAALGLSMGIVSPLVAQETPKRGGRLRVGMVGGGTSETLDPNRSLNEIDIARTHVLFDQLTDIGPGGEIVNVLAEEFSPNADGSVWKIRVRSGVTFHDGSPLRAQDVAYSFRYILDPETKSQGAKELTFLQPQNVRAVDDTTVELELDQPIVMLPVVLSSRAIYMFKEGTKDFEQPIGTGAFKFEKWTRAERSLFSRHDGYWRNGRPHLDELEIIAIDDASARVNALAAGQIDALAHLDPKLAKVVEANPNLETLNKPSGVYTCQYMFVDVPPFDDPMVREAMRLLVDRQQIVDNALLGFGRVGNDLSNWFDTDYAGELPQRAHDPEKARDLLKKAGHDNLSISLATSDVAVGMVDSSTLIAEQAKQAGVTVNIDKAPADQYWSTHYLQTPFGCTHWGYRPLDSQIAQGMNSNAPFNETHWMREDFDKLTNEARKTLDEGKRRELWVAAQTMLWEEGGYIIWGFLDNLDAHANKVKGLEGSVVRPLGWYAFEDVWLA